MTVEFSEQVVVYLNEEKGYDYDTIITYQNTYILFLSRIKDLPPIETATVDDMIAFAKRNTMEPDQTWEEFKELAIKEHLKEADSVDVYHPIWDGKTDDRPTVWAADTACATAVAGGVMPTVSDTTKEKLAKVLRYSSPFYTPNVLKRLSHTPEADTDAMQLVLNGMVKSLTQFFVWELGSGDNYTWRWSVALPLIAGLGLSSVRFLADQLSDNEGWSEFAAMTDAELTEEIVKARNCSGYPIGLLRCDFLDLYHAVENEPVSPKWFKTIVALHVLKHCRIVHNVMDGYNGLMIAYRGRHGLITYSMHGHHQGLGGSSAHKNTLHTLKSILRFPSVPANQRTAFHMDIEAVLCAITPSLLVERMDCRERPDIIVPDGVQEIKDNLTTREYRFIDTGMAVLNCSKVDMETGVVDKRVVLNGHYILSYNWPHGETTPATLEQWRYNLPDVVTARRASSVVFPLQRNLNFIGERKGCEALYDAMVFVGLMRDKILGCALNVAGEFPLCFGYPTGVVKDDVTNQGKTNFCRISVRIFVPEFKQAVVMNRSDSAPVQRTLAVPIARYGTAIYDEFILPNSTIHFLNKESLQGMATGNYGSPGEAGGNSPGVLLKYPLFFTAKVAPTVPDIRNRQLAFFLDKITDENRASSEGLELLDSGRVPTLARLSMMMYIHKNGLLAKVKKLKPVSEKGGWRFSSHMAIAVLFAGGDIACVKNYLAAAEQQCTRQLLGAQLSGLTDEIGVTAPFSLSYFWEQASESTIVMLAANSAAGKKHGGVTVLHTIRDLITDSPPIRRFEQVLASFHVKEHVAVHMVVKELQEKPLVRGPWMLKITPIDPNAPEDCITRKRQMCMVIKIEEPTKTTVDANATAVVG